MRKILKFLTSKLLIVGLLLIMQVVLFAILIFNLNIKFPYVYLSGVIISLFAVLYVVSTDSMNPAYKIAWLIVILAIPILGVVFFLIFTKKKPSKKRFKKYYAAVEMMIPQLKQTEETLETIKTEDLFFYNLANYMEKDSYHPAYSCDDIKYFKVGEEYFESLVEELKKAEKYIFLEFFIIERGYMWNTVLDILKEKIASGVDVRLIYDDFGTLMKVPSHYYKTLENMGLKVLLFNKFKPIVDVQMNNRTHRKIVVIDGKVAFTGGINLADEYINRVKIYGHWKDTGIMVKGKAVKSFVMMFLQLWAGKEIEDYSIYTFDEEKSCKSFIIPFSDTPMDASNVCENAYIKMIYNAKEYCYISTPYLIIDNEMKTALKTASKSGVDVRIIVPHIPDKKLVFSLTRAFYTELIFSGVKIYEYTPGFIHGKSIVSDGKYSFVGTTNMDFRSFYLHFECGALMYNKKLANDITTDFLNTFAISEEIKREKTKVGIFHKIKRGILRLFAPLL